MLVFVVISCFNSGEFIGRCLDSVLMQSHYDLQVIVCDNASSDESVSYVASRQALDKRIELICFDENRGAGAARNAGLDRATGQFVAFLDSNDVWVSPEKIEKQIFFMFENNRYSVSPVIGCVGLMVGSINW